MQLTYKPWPPVVPSMRVGTLSIGGIVMSRQSKYVTQIKAKDVAVMRQELMQEYGLYVKFTLDYATDAVCVTGRAYSAVHMDADPEVKFVSKWYRGAPSWTNPHQPVWSVLADIYDQAERVRVDSLPQTQMWFHESLRS